MPCRAGPGRTMCMYACMHVCMYACMHVCMYVYMHVACRHVCMYACMYALCVMTLLCFALCMYACMHACVYACQGLESSVCCRIVEHRPTEKECFSQTPAGMCRAAWAAYISGRFPAALSRPPPVTGAGPPMAMGRTLFCAQLPHVRDDPRPDSSN